MEGGGGYGVAVDIGATNTRVAVGDAGGRLLAKASFQTRSIKAPRELAEKIALHARELASRLGVEPSAVGVGTAGPLDPVRGRIVNSPNMPFKEIPLAEPLREELGLPVAVANDCNAAVIGEKTWGAGRGLDNLVYVTISTGIGGGAYVDGVLLLGKDGNAAEIGHIVVDSEERLVCGCGGRGHWEAYSSGSGIPRLAALLAQSSPDLWSRSMLSELGTIAAKDVFKAYRDGDPFAKLVIGEVRRYNAYGFAAVVNNYDPELITVGGSVALYNPDVLLRGLRRDVERYAINRVPEIELTPLGGDAVLLGALAIALGREEKVKPV